MTKKSTRRPDPIKELIAEYDAMTLNQLFDTRIRLSAEVAKSKVTWQMARRRLNSVNPAVAIVGGPYLWRGLVLLALLAVIGAHPIFGTSLLVAIVFWPLARWVLKEFFTGFLVAEGVKKSGILRQLRPRVPRRRERGALEAGEGAREIIFLGPETLMIR